MYSEDYYLLLQEFSKHPVRGTLLLIGFGISLYLLYLVDKRHEKRKQQELQQRQEQLYNEQVKRYKD